MCFIYQVYQECCTCMSNCKWCSSLRIFDTLCIVLIIWITNNSPHNDSQQLNNDSYQLNNDSPQLNYDSQQLNNDSPQLNSDSPQLNNDSQQLNNDSQCSVKNTSISYYNFTVCVNTKAMKQWLQRTPGLTRPIKSVFHLSRQQTKEIIECRYYKYN